MKEKPSKAARVIAGILFDAILTAFLSFLINSFMFYLNYEPKGGFISFDRKSSSFIMGISGAILGGIGGLISGGLIGVINSSKVKSIIIGGTINLLIPIMFIYTLDGSFKGSNKDLQSFGILIFGQLIAGGIAGFLISSFFNFSDNNNDDTKHEEKDNSLNIFT